jgi:molecular chaperone GrpE
MSDEKIPDVPAAEEAAPISGEAVVAELVDPLEAATADAARFKEQALRALADLDNYRKRSAREIEAARRGAKEDLIREMLPVFDNVQRGIQSAERAEDVKSVVEGLGMVLRQFETTLEKAGVKKVPTIGAVFDPQVHEAIQQVETDDHAPGTIVAEVQGGYIHGERLVRAALVVVAKPKATPPAEA